MQIVSVYGDNRSGKNFISEELSRRLHGGFTVYETSLPIRRLTDALHAHTELGVATKDESSKDAQRALLQNVSKAMHDSFGPLIWVDLSLRDLAAQGRSRIIINGIRQPEGVAHIAETLGGINIWVEASRETIAERYILKGSVLTDEIYDNPWDTQIRPYKSRMDLIIRNDGNAEDTEADLRAAVGFIEERFPLL